MKFTMSCLAIVLSATLSHSAYGQLFKNLFGESGSNQQQPLGSVKSELGQNNGFGVGEQKIRWPKFPSLFKQQDPQSDVLGRSDMRDLSSAFGSERTKRFMAPEFLNDFNAKSKAMIDRTTVWARDKQQRLKEKTFERFHRPVGGPLGFWGGLGMLPGKNSNSTQSAAVGSRGQADGQKTNKPSYYAPMGSSQLTQPPVRTASNPDGQSTMRF